MASNPAQFKPGQSGNPAGRPKGARNKRAAAVDALFEQEAEEIASTAIKRAKAGNAGLIRLLLDRVAPPRRDRPLDFELPPMASAADGVAAMAAIAQAVASGELTPGEASALSGFVSTYARTIETADLEARVVRLEAGRIR